MGTNRMMFEAAIRQLATQVAGQYDGPRDRESVLARANEIWAAKGQEVLDMLAPDFEIEISDDLLGMCGEIFVGAIAEAAIEVAPRGNHQPLSLGWKHFGPSAVSSGAIPPNPVTISNYFIAWDSGSEQFVYAMSHDYHQFGHAWSFRGGDWRQLSRHAYRLGSAQQDWTGAYDPSRGGVVGWNVDGKAPIAVVIRDGSITALADKQTLEATAGYSDDPHQTIETSGETPVIEVENWDDLAAVFSYDRARQVWVLLAESGIWELDSDNAWTKCGPLPGDVLPEEIDGGRAFGNGGAGAVWDGPRSRVVFWFSSDEELHLASWDGERLARVDTEGLPQELFPSFGDGGAVIAEHPEHGIVVYAGPRDGLYRIEGSSWTAESPGEGSPARSRGASAGFAPEGDMLFGPGRYASVGGDEDDEDDEDREQNLFFSRANASWSRLGTVSARSAIRIVKGSGGWSVLCAAGGHIYATAWRASLETMLWDQENGWQVLVSEADGKAAFQQGSPGGNLRAALLEGPDGTLHAISDRGAVFRLDGDSWSTLAGDDDTFGKRRGFSVACDQAADRIVLWGGEVDDRKSADTLIFQEGRWKKAHHSRRPSDMQYNWDDHGFSVDFEMCFDTALERILRVGFEEIAVLDGESWVSVRPEYLGDYLIPSDRVLAHDPKTGQTLVICHGAGRVMRLDLGACEMVATIEAPEVEDRFPYRDCVFDPRTRCLQTHSEDEAHDRYQLDLGEVFDLAASLGARLTRLPEPGPEPVRLYRPDGQAIAVFFSDAQADAIVARTGVLGEKLATECTGLDSPAAVAGEMSRLDADRRAAGFGPASDLTVDVLGAALARPAWSLELADQESSGEKLPASRMGGLPSGILARDWPTDEEGQPMGFLLQIETPPELHPGGLAVFVVTDGTATEDPDNNCVVELTPGQLASPPGQAPGGVAPMTVTELILGERRLAMSQRLVDSLGAEDAELGNLLEQAASRAPGNDGDHVGGYPAWVQSAETDAPLLLQIDFDGISLDGEEGWDEAGLFGVLYVFRAPDGAFALWQYT